MSSETIPKIRSLMVVDDIEDDLFFYERIVKRSGIVENYVAFDSAENALDHLRVAAPGSIDVILLDINMPRMSGFEFLDAASAELGEKFVNVVVFMLTSSLAARDMERAKKYSVVRDYFSKPLTVEQLRMIAGWLT